jgi:hypothetical protein
MEKLKWQYKLLFKAISFPILITLSSFIPNLNYGVLFCHGGLGWLLLALSFPWVLGVIIMNIKKQVKANIKNHVFYGSVILILYIALSYPLAIIFQKGILAIGNNMELKHVYEFYFFPFSLFFH